MTKQLSWRTPLQPGQSATVCVDFWSTQELIEVNGISPEIPVQAAVTIEAGHEAGQTFVSEPATFPFTMKIADD